MGDEMEQKAYIDWGRHEVASRAHELWKDAGCPNGRDLQYWLQAVLEILAGRSPRNPGGDGHALEEGGDSSGKHNPATMAALYQRLEEEGFLTRDVSGVETVSADRDRAVNACVIQIAQMLGVSQAEAKQM